MPKYRKLPVVIEAYQTDVELDIYTLEGVMHASAGDWIITGVNGENYPCKPDIFSKTYEPADAAPDPATRLADAAERIADALEALAVAQESDDPDDYDYDSCNVSEIDTLRAQGWRVLGMSTEYGSISLRRPRQEGEPTRNWFRVGDFVFTPDDLRAVVVDLGMTTAKVYLLASGEIAEYDRLVLQHDPIPF